MGRQSFDGGGSLGRRYVEDDRRSGWNDCVVSSPSAVVDGRNDFGVDAGLSPAGERRVAAIRDPASAVRRWSPDRAASLDRRSPVSRMAIIAVFAAAGLSLRSEGAPVKDAARDHQFHLHVRSDVGDFLGCFRELKDGGKNPLGEDLEITSRDPTRNGKTMAARHG